MDRVKFAVSPDIKVGGVKFKPTDLSIIGEIVGDRADIELTTHQQLIVDMEVEQAGEAKEKLISQGLRIYEVGFVVKNLAVCSFCKGDEAEGLETAKKLNDLIAGIPVPFPLRVGYSGCPNACGESLSKDIGVIKRGDFFDVYIGGETKTTNAVTGHLLFDQVDEQKLFEFIQRIIDIYKHNGKKRERFSRFVNRYGFETIKAEVLGNECNDQ